MRAMLIVNPFATSTTPAGRDALVNTLNSRFDLVVEHTTHRGHAGELAARARAEAFDVVVVHGGDGSVNEVVNGILGSPGAPRPESDELPAVGVIPGGSANVFARAVGIEPDPLRATGQLIELLQADKKRAVNLGHTDDRWFIFNCGMGIDAMVVREMERKRNAGKAATPNRYLRTTVATFIRHSADAARFDVDVELHPTPKGAHAPIHLPDVAFGFVSNASPWTYLGGREIRTNPTTGFDNGLGIFAASSMGVLANLPLAYRLLANAEPKARHLYRNDDVREVTFTASQPLDVQMDGDYIGTHQRLKFSYRKAALQIVAP
ncbi:diacylglycerol kinase family lipid kinase [Gordonia sp. TBRC 11910]|uniref:Diacylglycerol kinase family lipid kinase n=1 Tax=Gordonia asplenii TaxID=2725283 RepID=A0A848KZV3_9ACTN|nr:diacylglycerol kinase family lipid kinase [Gordonia asplenii]